MPRKKAIGEGSSLDPADDAPFLTKEMFDRAEIREGGRVIRRGRPPIENPRQLISIRLSPHVITHFKSKVGPKWQSAINKELERLVERQKAMSPSSANIDQTKAPRR